MVVQFIFPRSVSESPLDFQITSQLYIRNILLFCLLFLSDILVTEKHISSAQDSEMQVHKNDGLVNGSWLKRTHVKFKALTALVGRFSQSVGWEMVLNGDNS